MRIPSGIHRRTKGIRPPTGVALQYAALVRSWLTKVQARILELVLEGWDRNPVHFSGQVPSARTDSTFISKRLGTIQVELEQSLDPAHLGTQIGKFAKKVQDKNKIEFKRVIGISSADTGMKTTLDRFQDQNVDLIRSLAKAQLDDVRSVLENAETEGLRVEELSKRLEGRFSVTKSKADLLAVDQVLKLNGQLTQTRQKTAGITRYIWTTSNDERVRPRHAELEGTIQEWAVPPEISDDGRTGHPGDDYRCRCTAFPILDELGDEGLDQALGGFRSLVAARPDND